jgi:hypothetical protein
MVGAAGAAAGNGLKELEAADADEVPNLLVAVTVNV